MKPTALIIESDELSGVGYIADAAQARGYELARVVVGGRVDAFDGINFPDLVVVGGSDEHWYDLDEHHHLQRELEWLRSAISCDVPILGLCFGGQALAMALGGDVKPLGMTELGWITVASARPDVIPSGPWFSWHSDHFSLPDGAELLARNEVSDQAFRMGPHLGLQFHPEVSPELLEPWLRDAAAFGADPDALFHETQALAPAARVRAFALFDQFLALQDEA